MPTQSKLSAVYLICVFLAGCGGGTDTPDAGSDPLVGSDDSTNQAPESGPAPEAVPTPEPGSAPSPPPPGSPPAANAPAVPAGTLLTSSQGAAPGLPGCLNKGLYAFGEIQVYRRYKYTADTKTESQPIQVRDQTVNAVYKNESGSYGDSVYTLRPVGSDFYYRFRQTNDTIFELGTTIYGSYLANPEPAKTYFDMDVGQTVRSNQEYYNGLTSQTGGPRLTSTDWDQTYLGRQTIEVPAGTFETCRVEVVTAEAFKDSWYSIWYAVGSGIIVKSINYQPQGTRDDAPIMTFTSELIAASIGTEEVEP